MLRQLIGAHKGRSLPAILRKGLPGIIALSLSLLVVGYSSATTVVLHGTADLLEKSETVVRGTVTSVQARMHQEHQFIYTYVTLRVDEVLKGQSSLAGSSITLQELGGQVDDLIHHVPGVPVYEEGEEVLSFVHTVPVQGTYRTYGMIQGKFRFDVDERTGRQVLTRSSEWTATSLAWTGEAYDLTPARPDGNYEAAPLLQAIRDNVAGQ
jgi:hypothetical protein